MSLLPLHSIIQAETKIVHEQLKQSPRPYILKTSVEHPLLMGSFRNRSRIASAKWTESFKAHAKDLPIVVPPHHGMLWEGHGGLDEKSYPRVAFSIFQKIPRRDLVFFPRNPLRKVGEAKIIMK